MITSFKCTRSGNVVSFTNQDDIAGLRKHEGYIEVKEIASEHVKIKTVGTQEPIIQKRGRPSKAAII